MSTAPEAISAEHWTPGTGQDPAKYLVNPGHWDASSKRMTPGDLAHARPWLDSGRLVFIWPVPTEGFRRTGNSTLALHHYIGDQYVDAQVIHRDEARIELTGVFPGLSAQDNMAELINVLNDDPPEAGMTLNVPGVFEQVKFVIPENWDFSHDTDDQTHSISYTITFVAIGEGRRIPDPSGQAPVNPGPFPGSTVQFGGKTDPYQIWLMIEAGSQPGAPTFQGYAPPGGIASGGGGAGPDSFGGNYQWDPQVAAQLDQHYANYTRDQIGSAVDQAIAEHGGRWGQYSGSGGPEDPRILEIINTGNGYAVRVKVGTPEGNSTEVIPLPPAGSGVTTSTSYAEPTSQDGSIFTDEFIRSLMDIAEYAYGDYEDWEQIYEINQQIFDQFGIDKYEAPRYNLPVGVKMQV